MDVGDDQLDAGQAAGQQLGELEAARIAELRLDESKNFVKLRQTVRQVLTESWYAEELDQRVRLLLE
ncbi:hypothetical protein [Streptomyces sp. NPDC005096]|uniref:hypothetical protein n=1 Tax=Streptomyces sp. NPDC005096 TaxID=3154559 RepID=UPI0033A8FA4B